VAYHVRGVRSKFVEGHFKRPAHGGEDDGLWFYGQQSCLVTRVAWLSIVVAGLILV